jgi:hypothetical protein
MKTLALWMIAAACFIAPASAAQARSAYDGSWDLVFVTQRGSCNPTYNFTVNVSDGVVTHPNLVKFRGYVAKSGSVHASVTVHDKFASGTGQAFRVVRSRNVERPRGKRAMLGLLDSAAQLTSPLAGRRDECTRGLWERKAFGRLPSPSAARERRQSATSWHAPSIA